MNVAAEYYHKTGGRRLAASVIGNIFIGIGISIFKLSGLGNDPFSGMVMALSDLAGIHYANFLILVNVAVFAVELISGREYVGPGTAVNALLLGYIVTFFYGIWGVAGLAPVLTWQRVVTVCIGVVVCSFGLSLYQTSDVGVAPYDSLALIMQKRMPGISYFWHRIFWDGLCALICFLAGGIVGLGTLVSAFGLGPVVHFFNVHVSGKLAGTGRIRGRLPASEQS